MCLYCQHSSSSSWGRRQLRLSRKQQQTLGRQCWRLRLKLLLLLWELWQSSRSSVAGLL
jgi:hypothetical protein